MNIAPAHEAALNVRHAISGRRSRGHQGGVCSHHLRMHAGAPVPRTISAYLEGHEPRGRPVGGSVRRCGVTKRSCFESVAVKAMAIIVVALAQDLSTLCDDGIRGGTKAGSW